MNWWHKIDPDLASNARFTPLLVSLVVYIFFVLPLVDPGPERNLVVNVVFSVLLVSGVFAVSQSKRARLRTAMLVGGLMIMNWWKYFHQSTFAVIVAVVIVGVAILAGILMVLGQVLRARRVSAQTIQGAICGYLLLVLWWSFLYFLVATLQEESFRGLGSGLGGGSIDYIYFSFVTMTTLGFGDISPISEAARSLVNMQALVGQFYMAILVARLVAIQTRGER